MTDFMVAGLAVVAGAVMGAVGLAQDDAETTTIQDAPPAAEPRPPGQALWQRMESVLNMSSAGPPPEPTTWQECADTALEKAMAKAHVFHDMGPMIKLSYDLAVCDRTFPEAGP